MTGDKRAGPLETAGRCYPLIPSKAGGQCLRLCPSQCSRGAMMLRRVPGTGRKGNPGFFLVFDGAHRVRLRATASIPECGHCGRTGSNEQDLPSSWRWAAVAAAAPLENGGPSYYYSRHSALAFNPDVQDSQVCPRPGGGIMKPDASTYGYKSLAEGCGDPRCAIPQAQVHALQPVIGLRDANTCSPGSNGARKHPDHGRHLRVYTACYGH